MREQATLSRRALAALPIVAFAGTPRSAAAAVPALSPADDAALLDLGRRWAEAWDAQVAHDRAWSPALSEAEKTEHETIGDKIFADEQEFFDAIAATPARTIAGLALKAQILARAHDVEDRGIEAVGKAAGGAWELTTRAALSLVIDVLKLAQVAA